MTGLVLEVEETNLEILVPVLAMGIRKLEPPLFIHSQGFLPLYWFISGHPFLGFRFLSLSSLTAICCDIK